MTVGVAEPLRVCVCDGDSVIVGLCVPVPLGVPLADAVCVVLGEREPEGVAVPVGVGLHTVLCATSHRPPYVPSDTHG